MEKGSIVARYNKLYIVTHCDDQQITLQILHNGRPGRGRPVNMPLTRFAAWLDPRAVSQFNSMTFIVGHTCYSLISYDKAEERFVLRGVNPDGSYKRGRPRLMYIEDFAEEEQAQLKIMLSEGSAICPHSSDG
mgnify:CR=1 FL=1